MAERFDFAVSNMDDVVDAIERFGFVPLFENSIPGFSIEEHTPPRLLFGEGDGDGGVWEWKGPIIRRSGCAYGKFFGGKAVFISRKWFPDFANLRRNGYDFDSLADEGLARREDAELYSLLSENAPILSRWLKSRGGYGRGGKKGFDGAVTRLQRQCYALISDFIYDTDSRGNVFGWGVAEYSTPERYFGRYFTDRVYRRTPEESRDRVAGHLRAILPSADGRAVERILG